MSSRRHFTVVSFHAHPDDEALLTSGTLARAAASGHRVVLVVATAGEAGLASGSFDDDDDQGLARHRRVELAASARAIGAARVVVLGYPDSGWSGPVVVGRPPGHDSAEPVFSRADPAQVASELAVLLREEDADVLTIYDPAGGYGHPDHVQVHRVGLLAAELAGTPVVLEATLDRRVLLRGVRLLTRLGRFVPLPEVPDLHAAYTDHDDLTHRVDVRRFLDAKKASLRAHASQASGDRGPRTLALLLRLPRPVARRVLGREWFREVGRPAGGPLVDDIFDSLRARGRTTATDDDRRGLRRRPWQLTAWRQAGSVATSGSVSPRWRASVWSLWVTER
ncbi:MAG: LmbE family protein [Nocardioides sp.]|nr:LmbE family protein [Nocardioides sp.]